LAGKKFTLPRRLFDKEKLPKSSKKSSKNPPSQSGPKIESPSHSTQKQQIIEIQKLEIPIKL
jgi:hypothetical protein